VDFEALNMRFDCDLEYVLPWLKLVSNWLHRCSDTMLISTIEATGIEAKKCKKRKDSRTLFY